MERKQDWANLAGGTAWHLIDRHADNLVEIGKMMDDFIAAKVAVEREACAVEAWNHFMDMSKKAGISPDVFSGWCAAQSIRARGEK